ncbi:MAG TPA: FGGY-family carbohydrate kinase [Thermomicrobiales bacterium]
MADGPYLLGLDCGLTLTKAVVFDLDGSEVGAGEARPAQVTRRPRWVERDLDEAWSACVTAIRGALADSGVDGSAIAAVGPTAHGDSLYPIDGHGRPVRPAILSLDSRAHGILDRWRAEQRLDRALDITGQVPFASMLAPVLTWLRENEPESLARMRWALGCKDWIRYRLTGEIATDFTEASATFTDVRTQTYADDAFALYDLADLRERLPPVVGCAEVAGYVVPAAAAETGLVAGTPVAGGAHDVDATAVGAGCVHPGQLMMVAGTWSINEVIADRPATDARWVCRNFVEPGRWLAAGWSPASATNLEWFVRELCPVEVLAAEAHGDSPYAFVNDEAAAVWHEPSRLVFHPFLYGSPYGDAASAAFLGLRGWHRRGHLLRAVLEGVTFNHRTHVEALRSSFPVSEARLGGGGAQSALWSQLFADALNLPVLTTDAKEAGARGAALLAGVAAGVYSSLVDAATHATHVLHRYEPDEDRHVSLLAAYDSYRAAIDALTPVWPQLE